MIAIFWVMTGVLGSDEKINDVFTWTRYLNRQVKIAHKELPAWATYHPEEDLVDFPKMDYTKRIRRDYHGILVSMERSEKIALFCLMLTTRRPAWLTSQNSSAPSYRDKCLQFVYVKVFQMRVL